MPACLFIIKQCELLKKKNLKISLVYCSKHKRDHEPDTSRQNCYGSKWLEIIIRLLLPVPACLFCVGRRAPSRFVPSVFGFTHTAAFFQVSWLDACLILTCCCTTEWGLVERDNRRSQPHSPAALAHAAATPTGRRRCAGSSQTRCSISSSMWWIIIFKSCSMGRFEIRD